MASSGKDKIVIYQIFTRLFGNTNLNNAFCGSLEENGVGKLNDISVNALKSIKKLGVSHVWYTGVIEHATMTDYSQFGIAKDHPLVVKGIAGSPYAIKDYYDIDPDLAENVPNRMAEFENLVNRTHKQGLKVIIDFIPNHVARQYKSDVKPEGISDFGENDEQSKAFDVQNNFYYLPNTDFKVPVDVNPPLGFEDAYIEKPAKATGNDVFSASPSIYDWYETVKLNYGIDYLNGQTQQFFPIPDTWKKMRHILLYWAGKGVDLFRCDMVHMVPVEFWAWVTKEVKNEYPDIQFIAEIYDPQAYHQYIFKGGFDYLYDKVGLYDALKRLIQGHGNANDITRVWQNESGDFSNHMLRFLENHDEHRITSEEFAGDAAGALTAMALSTFLHEGPIMLYFGQEIGLTPTQAEGFSGNDGRTTIFDYWGLEEIVAWNNQGKWNTAKLSADQKALRKRYQEILSFGTKNEAIHSGKFFDCQYVNGHGQSLNYNDTKLYTFLRYTNSQRLLFVFNFDQQNSYETEILIPELALDLMGLTQERINLTKFSQRNTHIEMIKNKRFDLRIEANSWLVFELN